MTWIDKVLEKWRKYDGAFSEKGGLIYNTEVHSFVMGVALAELSVYETSFLPVLISACVAALGLNLEKKTGDLSYLYQRVKKLPVDKQWVNEIRREPHYFLSGAVLVLLAKSVGLL